MARYSLILKDSDYILLVQNAQQLNLSLGKYLNKVLHETATLPIKIKEKVCLVCGKPPKLQTFAYDGTPLYFCNTHSHIGLKFPGHKEMPEIVARR